jgi:hypothetical protein
VGVDDWSNDIVTVSDQGRDVRRVRVAMVAVEVEAGDRLPQELFCDVAVLTTRAGDLAKMIADPGL